MRRYYASVIVAVKQGGSEVLGYYSLSTGAISRSWFPDEVRKKLPRYEAAPAVLLGRLAVASTMQHGGLGKGLLGDAVARACQYGAAWAVFLVSAKHGRAAAYYKQYGFTEFAGDPLLLWAPRKSIQELF